MGLNMEFYVDEGLRKLIPPLSEGELSQLEENLKREGCRDPLVIWKEKGILLDGHHRQEICGRHQIPFETVTVSLPDRNAAKAWVITNQFGRRNLAPFVRAELALKLEPLIAQQAKERQREGGRIKVVQNSAQASKTREEVARVAGVSHDTIDKAKVIAQHAPEDVKAQLRSGETTINAAYTRIQREKRREDAAKGLAASPKGKYRVLYADPPWKYGDTRDGLEGTTGATAHYPTMSITELCDLPVQDWIEDNAVLFLWVTSPLLFECQPVIKAWGFQYKTSFVWDKVKHNLGHYNSVRHEFLLVCTRGSCIPDVPKLFDSVQTIERGEHSAKPDEFREMIDHLYPHGRRLELFARRKVGKWEAYGNDDALLRETA